MKPYHVYLIIFVVLILPLLEGCSATTQPYRCTTCVGPYDMTLNSHREAVLGKRKWQSYRTSN